MKACKFKKNHIPKLTSCKVFTSHQTSIQSEEPLLKKAVEFHTGYFTFIIKYI